MNSEVEAGVVQGVCEKRDESTIGATLRERACFEARFRGKNDWCDVQNNRAG